jgi:general secretion pathway protein N
LQYCSDAGWRVAHKSLYENHQVAINKKLITIGIGLFFALLIWQLPARLIFVLLPASVAQGFHAEGTVWNGRVRIINVAGQQLRNTEWNLAISRLLLGQLAIDFKTRWGGGFAEGFASISATGKLRLSDTVAGMDTAMLSPILNIPQLGGQASLNIAELVLVDNWPQTLTGSLEIRNLASPLMGNGGADLIGNVAVTFAAGTDQEAGTLTGKLSDTGGPLQLDGTLLLTAPANYAVSARLQARPEAAKSLRDNLEFLGSPEADGNYVFELAGSL